MFVADHGPGAVTCVVVHDPADTVDSARCQVLAAETGNGCAVALVPDPGHGTPPRLRFFSPGGELPFSGRGLLAAARILGSPALGEQAFDTHMGRVRVMQEPDGSLAYDAPATELMNYGQPAFAARVLTRDPLELDARHFPAATSAGVPFLVIPVREPRVLREAVFAQWRLDDLMPRVGAKVVAALATDSLGTPDAPIPFRAFTEILGVPEDAANAEAAGAIALWLHDTGLMPDSGTVEVETPEARVRVHCREDATDRAQDGAGVRVRVSGRVGPLR